MEDDVLRKYLGLIRRWWWLFLVGVIIPMGASYYFVSNQPDMYQAKVTLMVGTTIWSREPDERLIRMSNTLAQAYAELVRRRPITEAVIERLNYHASPEALARQISTRLRTDAQLLEITVTDLNPRAASLIANALADELVQQSPGSSRDMERREFIERQLEALQAKIEQVEAKLAEETSALAGLTSAIEMAVAEERIDALERVQTRYQPIYASLLQSMMSDQGPNILTIVEPAPPFGWPLPRRTGLIVGLAGLAGLCLALGGVLLIEYVDDSLRWEGPGQQSVLGLPVLGGIVHISPDENPLVVRTKPGSQQAESIRNVRTSIQLHNISRPLKVLLITSPSPSDGKSVVAANLAISLAGLDRKTLLIDADLRKRQLHKLFQIPNGEGLVDVLSDSDIDLLSTVQETSVSNLSLLRAGRPPLDSASLLSSARFADVLRRLKAQFDFVVMDSPAALAVPDASILATKADGVLILVDAEAGRRRMLLRAKNALAGQGRNHLLGVVFNRVRLTDQYYRYYH